MSESLQAISPIDNDQDRRDFFSPSPILEEDKLQTVKEQVRQLTFCALLHSLTQSSLCPWSHKTIYDLSVMYLSYAPNEVQSSIYFIFAFVSAHSSLCPPGYC